MLLLELELKLDESLLLIILVLLITSFWSKVSQNLRKILRKFYLITMDSFCTTVTMPTSKTSIVIAI